jgi:hypothetical protein
MSSPRLALLGLCFCLLVLPACHPGPPGELTGRAADEWVRSYPLAPDGELQIVAGTGTIEVQGGTGTAVDVRAERIARAVDQQMAADVLPRIAIREEVTPEKVLLQTEGLGGVVIGVEVDVNYHITVPNGTRLRLRSANGAIDVHDFTGHVVASSANGRITVTDLSGGIEARAQNGNVTVSLARFGPGPVDIRAASGVLDLALPADTAASLLATARNGTITVGDLPFEPSGEQTERRVRGSFNAGGPPIELNTVNGSIRVHSRQ